VQKEATRLMSWLIQSAPQYRLACYSLPLSTRWFAVDTWLAAERWRLGATFSQDPCWARNDFSRTWGRHSRRTHIPRNRLRFKINRSAIGPIHVERHGRVIVDDTPSPARLLKTRRRAVPYVLVFIALAPAHSVER
jgi:hypothetical protein